MKISEIGVRQPVMTAMIFLSILIVGVISYMNLSIDMLPEIENPTVTVITSWSGASTEDVETQITRVLESALGSVTDLDEISSTTSEGMSRVQCKFKWGTNLDEAANNMRDLIERAKRRLPDDADLPLLHKFNSSNMPILVFGITCRENREKMEDIVETDIVDVIKRIPGVGTSNYMGGLKRQINVYLDPDKLAAYGLSVIEIAEAIDRDNETEPAGNIRIGRRDYTIRVPGEFDDPRQIEGVILKRVGDKLVRVGDVARVEDSFVEENSVVERDGARGMFVDVQKRSGENTVAVVSRVLKRMEDIKKTLPADYNITVIMDSSDAIKKSIRSVSETVLYGGLFVILTTLFFLRSFRAALVISLTIPFSLIIAFAFMYFMGWTINIMSMSAMAVAIGMVVDNAVVVLENIFSHMARGTRRREAAMFGADEVGTAIIASTLTTIVVFVPLVFVEGVSGIMMKQLGGLVVATLLASVVCALMLTPMLASKLITPEVVGLGAKRPNAIKRAIGAFLDWIDGAYAWLLARAIRLRALVVLLGIAIIGITVWSLRFVGSEFMGSEDTGQLNITFYLPLSTRYEKTTEVGRRVVQLIKDTCGTNIIETMSMECGGTSRGFGGTRASNIGQCRIKFVDAKYRDKTADQYGVMLTREISSWPEVTKCWSSSNNFLNRILRGGGAEMKITLFGYDLDRSYAIGEKIRDLIMQVPGTRDAHLAQEMGQPELYVRVNRDKASAMGVSMRELTTIVSTLFQGNNVSQYREGEDEYDITLRLDTSARNTIEDIRASEISLSNGKRVRLDTFADVVEETGPLTISRQDQQRKITVEFDSNGERPDGDVMNDVCKAIEENILFPYGITWEPGGKIEDQRDTEKAMAIMISLGIILVYMVMASQFESLLHPLLIMLSMPFALSGVVVGLLLTGTPLSMSAYIGIILLVGVVVNNAIVLVDYINISRERGIALMEAVVSSGRQRLRPVLITTFTTLLGMLPLALSHGDGSATWRPLGIVVVGGLSVSTIVSMIVVPVLYYGVERIKEKRLARKVSA